MDGWMGDHFQVYETGMIVKKTKQKSGPAVSNINHQTHNEHSDSRMFTDFTSDQTD